MFLHLYHQNTLKSPLINVSSDTVKVCVRRELVTAVPIPIAFIDRLSPTKSLPIIVSPMFSW